ncbi:aminotransferase class I/II-fold pyridoxal phosphate-dependent enzyme [Anaerococcus sp. AGMB09787]|uniref:aminotransferase class I/II-fold pyridoxal phosphate-dependent enzyme n=1 Tax=Anaerococcus sp. AGMB09787 TaxID=2922869 RepID=UPI001FAF4CB2|nr:aminotransferase class I/II-fold pyridoxal phosphate-dependent enzyme [Anaerococcus sp. AGMB09787]
MLKEKLDQYLKENYYPFHMPGNKRSELLDQRLGYGRDLTEIEGFDNLNDPKDLFIAMQNKLAEIYRVKEALITTNGSTSGILSSIRAMTKDNKNILVQRSAHKSVYNAIELYDLDADYLEVRLDEVNAVKDINYQKLEKILAEKDYGSLVVTSPSYEGYILDLDRIYDLCQKYKTKLLVDLAHGSHLLLNKLYTNSFDVAVTSFHKNLSSLTPSAGLLINDRGLFDEIKRNLAIFQTSSPSYLILQSIDEMIENFGKFYDLYEKLDNKLNKIYGLELKNLKIIDYDKKDRSKILISTKDTTISGKILRRLLRDRKIEVEMAYPEYALLIATIFDINEGFDRLSQALVEIDKEINKKEFPRQVSINIPKKKMKIYEAVSSNKEKTPLDEALGKISSQYVYAYPPGIPLLVPGEVIDREVLSTISYFRTNDFDLNIDGEFIYTIIDKVNKN